MLVEDNHERVQRFDTYEYEIPECLSVINVPLNNKKLVVYFGLNLFCVQNKKDCIKTYTVYM